MNNKLSNVCVIKNKKGITMTSLIIYVIVATIVVSILAFLNANFFSNINDLTGKSNIVAERLKFQSAFLRDIKADNNLKVTDFNSNMIKLSNNVQYEIRLVEEENEDKKYAIYRNNVQIAKSIVPHTEIDGQEVKEGPYFEYDATTNTVKVGLRFYDGKNPYIEDGTYVVGRDVKVEWESSPYFSYTPNPNNGDSSSEEDPTIPEDERIYAYLYSDGELQIGKTKSVDANKTVYKTYGEISKTLLNGKPKWLEDKNKIRTVNFYEYVEVKNLENIFSGCTNLTQIINADHVNCLNAKSAKNAFKDCISLTSLDITSWNTSQVTDMSSMFEGCASLNDLKMTGLITTNVINMSKMFKNCSSIKELSFDTISTEKVRNMSEMFSGCTLLTTLDLNRLVTTNLMDMSSMFSNCTSLVTLKIEYLDTSNVSSVSRLFYNCQSLASVTISEFDSKNITDLSYLFYNCMNLETVTFESIDTSNVTDMSYMFSNCTKLKNINLEKFKTANVKNMAEMFHNCQALEELDLTGWETNAVTNMAGMFAGCINLTNIENIKELDTYHVSNMSQMFMDCRNLETLDLEDAKFTTISVTNMSEMFKGCRALEDLAITSFITNNVTNMSSMFEDCLSLIQIDLSSFDNSRVTDMSKMFKNASSLETIYVGNLWVSNGASVDVSEMFEGAGTSLFTKI